MEIKETESLKLNLEGRELLILEKSNMKLPLRRKEQDARDAGALLFYVSCFPKNLFYLFFFEGGRGSMTT